MPVVLSVLAILLYALGALSLALLLQAAVSRRVWTLAVWLGALELLFLTVGTYQFLERAISGERLVAFTLLQQAGNMSVLAASLSAVYAGMKWAGVSRTAATICALSAAAALALPSLLLGAALSNGIAAAACLAAGHRTSPGSERRFYATFGSALGVPAVFLALGQPLDRATLSYVPPIAVLLTATLRQNVFGLLIRRQTLIVVTLGLASVPYLVLTKILAAQIGERLEAFTSIVEATLLLAAAVIWLPLLSWTMRVLGRRRELYAEFGRRVINEAVPILNAVKRAEFLANGIRRLLRVKEVKISLLPDAQEDPASRKAAALFQKTNEEWAQRLRVRDEDWKGLFTDVPYNYVVALRQERRLLGILWVDSSPKQYLDEYEPVLLEIGRQTSHSLDSCRVLEEKLRLERSLLTQRQLAALGNVAATIAHEVRNPLSSIRALAQLMAQDAEFGEKYGQDLSYIMSETDRLNRSVEELLTYARPTKDEPGDVDVSQLINNMVQTLQKEKASKPVEVNSRVAPDLLLHHADGQRVKEVILNLIRNALQAVQDRGRVEVVAEAAEDHSVRLSVSDDGPGIPTAIQDKIFDPYFTTRQSGIGLGLSIVQKNVGNMHGKVEVVSPLVDGHGTKLTVVLPVDRAEGAP